LLLDYDFSQKIKNKNYGSERKKKKTGSESDPEKHQG